MGRIDIQCGNCGNPIVVEQAAIAQPLICPQCRQTLPLPFLTEDRSSSQIMGIVADTESIFSTPGQADDSLFGGQDSSPIQIPSDVQPIAPSEQPISGVHAAAAHTENTVGGQSNPCAPPDSGHVLLGPSPSPQVGLIADLPGQEEVKDCQQAEAATGTNGGKLEAAELAAHAEDGTDLEPLPAGAALMLMGDLPEALSGTAPPALPEDALASRTPPAADFGVSAATGSAAGLLEDDFPTALRRRAASSGARSGLLTALVIFPLISYSLLATIAVLILYFRPPQPSLEYLPDIEGDLQGAKRAKKPLSYQRLDPDSPLPDQLKVGLGQTIRIGDVEVSPQKIELNRIKILQADGTSLLPAADSLVLHLVMRNISTDVEFSPTDPFFDRQWKSSQDPKPYTFLELGAHQLYGGPLAWWPGRREDERKTVEGQTYQALQPGQSLTTCVCTDPTAPNESLLAGYQGELIWRIQVRRGLVRVENREVPATAVVGVRFRHTDILRPSS